MTKYWKKHFYYLLLNCNKIELVCNVFTGGIIKKEGEEIECI